MDILPRFYRPCDISPFGRRCISCFERYSLAEKPDKEGRGIALCERKEGNQIGEKTCRAKKKKEELHEGPEARKLRVGGVR